MRPVEKLTPGQMIVLEDGTRHLVQTDYVPYQKAKEILAANLGAVCSYCEAAYTAPRDYAVEHVQPKHIYGHLETKWSNFLPISSLPVIPAMEQTIKGKKM